MNGTAPDSPSMNPMDAFLDDLPQPAVDMRDTIHGAVTEFNLPTLSSPLSLLQDVGPGYLPLIDWKLT
jgi:hypothetical protein